VQDFQDLTAEKADSALDRRHRFVLVFARSANLSTDMNALMRAACERLKGHGGGGPDLAQGGGSDVGELNSALAAAMVIAQAS